MNVPIPTPWSYLFVLQELDLQIAALRHQRDLAQSLGVTTRSHLTEDAAKARRALPLTETRLSELEIEREGVGLMIPHVVLEPYERLREKSVAPPWVVRLTETTCPGCNTDVSAEQLRAAGLGRTPLHCSSCSRLLLWV